MYIIHTYMHMYVCVCVCVCVFVVYVYMYAYVYVYYSESPLKDTSEIRIPLYLGQMIWTQLHKLCANIPLK